jgi:hypothetical protein
MLMLHRCEIILNLFKFCDLVMENGIQCANQSRVLRLHLERLNIEPVTAMQDNFLFKSVLFVFQLDSLY